MSIRWDDEKLKEAGIPKKKLASLVKKLQQCSEVMSELGLSVYGSDNSGYLIHSSHPEHDDHGRADLDAIVADVGIGFDGGGW
jgi:hypothetical protein